MKQKRKMMVKTVVCSVLTAALLLVGSDAWSIQAYAAEDFSGSKNVDILQVELMDMSEVKPSANAAKTALNDCSIIYGRSSAGLHIEITTGCANGVASYLGVKDVKIEQQVWYGWKTIATGSGGQQSNCSIMGISIDYPNVTAGETYRISCVHYGDYNGYHEISNQTSAFVY